MKDLSSMLGRNKNKDCSGFTLIELLTVMAIFALLTAVTFPAVTNIRLRTQEAQVISNMRALHAAFMMYKQDENSYPASLGPATYGAYRDGHYEPFGANYNGLYPEWIRDRGIYESPANELGDPKRLYDAGCGLSGVRKWWPGYVDHQIDDVPRPCWGGAQYNGWNTMDGHVEQTPDGPSYVAHYFLRRTYDRNDRDYKRQLIYRTPREDTVVTWNDSFVQKNPDTGAFVRGDLLVLFLDGTVKKYDVKSRQVRGVGGQYWRIAK